MVTARDFLSFEKLITPTVIKVIYIVGIVVILIGTLVSFVISLFGGAIGTALLTLIGGALGLLGWRVYCELVMVLFGLYERAGEIRDRLPPPRV